MAGARCCRLPPRCATIAVSGHSSSSGRWRNAKRMSKWLRYTVGVKFMAVRLNKEEMKGKGGDKVMVSPCGVQRSKRRGEERGGGTERSKGKEKGGGRGERGEEKEGKRKARGKRRSRGEEERGEARRGRKARRGRGKGQGGEREGGGSRAQCAPGSLGGLVGWVQGDFVLKGLPADG